MSLTEAFPEHATPDQSGVLENTIRSVALYKHGVGFFEREARVQDDALIRLQFHSVDLDDVLKSFAVFDLDGGHIPGVAYEPGSEAIGGTHRETRVDWPSDQALSGLLSSLIGVRIALRLAGKSAADAGDIAELCGEILGLERTPEIDRLPGSPEPLQSPLPAAPVQLVLRMENSGAIRGVVLDEIAEFRLLDPQAAGDLGRSLQSMTYWKKQAARRLSIQAAGTGERRLRMRYSVPTPVWKVSYRILLPEPASAGASDAGELRVQGWALVDNTTEEDWLDVRLELIAGLPVSFQHNLTAPRYQRRPEVPVAENTALIGSPVAEEQAPRRRKSRAMARSMGIPPDEDDFNVGSAPDEHLGELSAQMDYMDAGPDEAAQRFAESFQAPVDVATAELDGGLSYIYRIKHPVSISRGESALVPLLSAGFAGRRVALYSPAIRSDNPMAAVLLTNDSPAAIEGGPVTVFDAERYAGEGMLRLARPGERQFLPYAVDLACRIALHQGSPQGQQRVFRSVVVHGTWILHSYFFAENIYTIDNSAGEHALELYLEHPIRPDMQLMSPPRPGQPDQSEPLPVVEGDALPFVSGELFEETASSYRFRVEVPAGAAVRLLVKERGESQQNIRTQSLNAESLRGYVAQGYLDEATRARMQSLLELNARLSECQREQRELREEGEELSAGQQRVRKNLQALKMEAGDADDAADDLRRRYLTQLAQDEDRFVELKTAGDRVVGQIAELEQKRDAILRECTQDLLLGKS